MALAPSLRPVTLAAIQLREEADGVAYVARLIRLALADLGADTRLLELSADGRAATSRLAQLRFAVRLTSAQVRHSEWVLFTHLGLARAQRLVPAPLRRPYAVFLHGIEAWDPELAPDRVDAMRKATLRIANSAYTARRISAAHPSLGSIAVCPLALLPEASRDTRPVLHPVLQTLRQRSVVIIGRMSAAERYKGHDELIECWPLVREQVPDAQLIMAGSGNDLERLKRKAAEAQLGDSVLFPGFVNDATRDALLERAVVFAMPSHGEGFGIVYLQAMRAGTPCIGLRDSAAEDVVVHGETGRLVGKGNREELAACIVSLLMNEEEARRLGVSGLQRFEREFTFEGFRSRIGPLLVNAFGVAEDSLLK